jgi:hypothetical protein
VVRSLRFDMTYRVPAYAEWLEREGHLEAYRFHKRFLQHLQHQSARSGRPRGRWVLKCPDHIFAFDALCAVYPDARFVFVHRDPLRVLPSMARLTEILKRPFTRRVDLIEVGRQASDRWVRGANLLVETAERLQTAPQRIAHVHYLDLVGSPLKAIAALYGHFGIPISEAAKGAMAGALAEKPNGGYGRNVYRWEDYGLDPAVEEGRFSAYMKRFQIAAEAFPENRSRRT